MSAKPLRIPSDEEVDDYFAAQQEADRRKAVEGRPRPPRGCYWRGNVLWGAASVYGKRYAWTLSTDDPKLASERREARVKTLRDPSGAEDAKRRLRAGERLTKDQIAFVVTAIDFTLQRGARAPAGTSGK